MYTKRDVVISALPIKILKLTLNLSDKINFSRKSDLLTYLSLNICSKMYHIS